MDLKTTLLIIVIAALLVVMLFVCIFSTCAINKLEQANVDLYGMIGIMEQRLSLEQKYSQKILNEKNELLQKIESLEEEEEEEDDDFVEGEEVTFVYDLSKYTTNMLCWMDYRKITDTTSMQYRIQERCDTIHKYGIRIYNGPMHNVKSITPDLDYTNLIYAVAMGSMFGRELGDIFEVTLMNGTYFYVFLAEFKDDGVTDPDYLGHPCTNFDDEDCTNVVEFIVDEDHIPIEVKDTGTFTALEEFGGLHGNGGNIKTIQYIGHIDF